MKYRATLFLLLLSTGALAHDSLIISRLLQRIADLQPKEHGVFPKGSIPSYRLYAWNKHWSKADINPFFTGLVSFTLQDIKHELSLSQQQQANTIITSSLPSFEKFRNRKSGSPTYNFWPTDTVQIFPHSGLLNWFDKTHSLPDDLDDTVIILMAMRASDSAARWVHNFMQAYANNGKKRINSTYKEYQDIGAYSTWFGKKMPVDFDISVMANVLYFVQSYNLPWTNADSSCLQLIERVVTEKKHITAASYVSPHYRQPSVILYHLSRLMALKPIPSLEKLKPQLIEEALAILPQAGTFMEEVILSTSLLRWGITPPETKPHKTNSLMALVESDQFSFFVANMASVLSNPWKGWIQATQVGMFYYHCPAYNNMLLLENLIWRKRRNLS